MKTIRQELEEYSQDLATLQLEARHQAKVDDNLIQQHLATYTEVYLRWAMLAAEAETRANRYEAEMDRVESECRKWAREQGKCTENMVKERAETSQAYLVAQEAYQEAKLLHETLKRIEKAFDRKGNMLQSINARQQREISAIR